MKFRLLSLLSVVLVLSIKAYETTAHELREERNRSDVYQPDLLFIDGEQFNPVTPIDSLVQILTDSEAVKERQVGFSGSTPMEYRAFEELTNIGTESELNGLLTHYSPVVRVYAYRALVANEMEIEAAYEETVLRDTASVDWFSGCLLIPSTVSDLVSQGFID